ncbi:MAG TPA: hypothetical protein VH393_12285, partial [Ktedonobacterales bacterium]
MGESTLLGAGTATPKANCETGKMNGALTDAELTRGAQAGDPACLGLLLERHRASMQVVALSLLGYSPETPD